MATVVKVNCEHCEHEAEMQPKALRLFIYSSGVQFYSFFCLACKRLVQKDASDAVVNLLIQGGVEATAVEVPEEFLEKKTGAPLTTDDLLDLVQALKDFETLQNYEHVPDVGVLADAEVPAQREPRRATRFQGPV